MSYVAQSGLDSLLEALRQSGMNTDGVGSGTGASDSASSGPQTPGSGSGSGSGAGAGASGSRGGVGGFPFGGFGGFGGAGNGGGRGHGGSGSGYGGDGGHGGPTVDFEFLANDFHLPSKKWLALIIVLAPVSYTHLDVYKRQAMEFTGSAIESMPMDERLSISNMAIEAGGKAGLIPVDDVTRAYLDERAERPYTAYYSDDDAQFAQVVEIDAADIVPTVAFPHLPSNTRPVAEARDVKIDQAVIGSCTNGRLADMRQAAAVLAGRTVHPDVRCIVIPATQKVYQQCIAEARII